MAFPAMGIAQALAGGVAAAVTGLPGLVAVAFAAASAVIHAATTWR